MSGIRKTVKKMRKVTNDLPNSKDKMNHIENMGISMGNLGFEYPYICQRMYSEFEEYLKENGYKFYLAYGSNMSKYQMSERCPNAKLYGKARVNGYKFVLDSAGVATLVKNDESFAEVLIWIVSEEDEKSLDRYEGVSSGCYGKTSLPVEMEKKFELDMLTYLSLRDLENVNKREGYMDKIIRAAKEAEFDIDYIIELESWNEDGKEKL